MRPAALRQNAQFTAAPMQATPTAAAVQADVVYLPSQFVEQQHAAAVQSLPAQY